MKELIWEIRMWLGWKLIGWAFDALPTGRLKLDMAQFLVRQPFDTYQKDKGNKFIDSMTAN